MALGVLQKLRFIVVGNFGTARLTADKLFAAQTRLSGKRRFRYIAHLVIVLTVASGGWLFGSLVANASFFLSFSDDRYFGFKQFALLSCQD